MWYGTMLAAVLLHATNPIAVPDSVTDTVTDRISPARTSVVIPAVGVVAPAEVARVTDTRIAPATSWSAGFAYASHGIFVRVALDDDSVGWFLLDTGASATVIDIQIARDRQLVFVDSETVEGTAGAVRAPVYRLGDVSVNGATAIAITGVAQDLSGFFAPNGERLAGILGSDFLGGFAVRVDFDTHQVMFSVTAVDSAAPGRTAVHFGTDHGAPRIPVMLDGHIMADFRIDTGLHGTYNDAPYVAVTDRVWRGLARAHLDRKVARQVNARGIGASDVRLPVARIDELTIGQHRVALGRPAGAPRLFRAQRLRRSPRQRSAGALQPRDHRLPERHAIPHRRALIRRSGRAGERLSP